MTVRRTLIAALAAAALIAPAAQADQQPPDMHASTALAAAKARSQAGTPDMHASTAEAAAKARALAESEQDQRAPGAPAADDGSPVPVIPIVAGALAVLVAALTAHYGVRRSSHRSRAAA